MNTPLQLLEQQLQCDTETATKVLDTWIEEYHELQELVLKLKEEGLSNSQIAEKIEGFNTDSIFLRNASILCDVDYKDICTTVHEDLTLSKDFNGYIENNFLDKFNLSESTRDMYFEVTYDIKTKSIESLF